MDPSKELKPNYDLLGRGEKLRITYLRKRLLKWYDINGRDFPWRRVATSNFKKICVEVLLQRTRAEKVAEFYNTFFKEYPSWSTIAGATIPKLQKSLKPIGLWKQRAFSIRALSRYASSRNGKFPLNYEELLDIPGVGQYVANSILLFQHNKPRPLLDSNMSRIIERYLQKRKLADIRYDPWLQAASHWLVRFKKPVLVNWAVMDYANAICRVRNPRCHECQMRSRCNYFLSKTANSMKTNDICKNHLAIFNL